MIENDIKEFCKKLNFTCGKYSGKDTFRDVISLLVFVIQIYMIGNKDYLENYNRILDKYTEDEQLQLKQLGKELAEIYNKQSEPADLMTELFGELGLGNKHTGQFFTPTHISDLLVKCTGIDDTLIKEKGYITLHEPASGAGGMILAFARELKNKGYNPSQNLFVVAWDIDILCTYMTYLQLAMYDIPAIVVNGDTLAMKKHFTLYTPQYYYGLWNLKELQMKEDIKETEQEDKTKKEKISKQRKVS